MSYEKIKFYCNWGVASFNGRYFLSPIHLEYLIEAKKRYKKVVLISKEASYIEKTMSPIPDDIDIILLPRFNNYLGSISKSTNIIRILYKESMDICHFYIRSPEPFSWVINLFSSCKNPLLYHFASNPLEAILNKKNDKKIVRYIKLLAFYPEYKAICRSAYKRLYSCNGVGLAKKLEKDINKSAFIFNESLLKNEHYKLIENRDIHADATIKVLYVGYLRPAKGLTYLLESISELVHKRQLKIHLNIVGDGDYKNELIILAKKLEIEENIVFHGHVNFGEELINHYRTSDVFILPSLSEGSPRVILEAMANSLPVIATNVGNIPNLLADDRGICISAQSSKEITNALNRYIIDNNYRRNVIRDAFHYSKNFSLEKFFDDVTGTLRNYN
ncbi:TPA: glycosyltransferase [Vibrio cholerae]|nr:glycosyltransferase [Vibrio cholerae]